MKNKDRLRRLTYNLTGFDILGDILGINNNLSTDVDIEDEYKLIKQKKSNLNRKNRDIIIKLYNEGKRSVYKEEN